MDGKLEEKAVLLGLAEVKAPFKNLTLEEKVRISHICYRKLLEIEPDEVNRFQEENLRCIGVVDSFYALQEVTFVIEHDECFLFRKADIILRNSLKDVIIALPAADYQSRVVLVSQTQNFGRTALVLQLRSTEAVQALVSKLLPGDQLSALYRIVNGKSNGYRRGADSFGRAMGKRMNNFFSSFGGDKSSLQITDANSAESGLSEESVISDDDDANCDSDKEDSADTSSVKSLVVNTLYEPRPSFERQSMGPLEAEIQYLINSEIGFVDTLKKLLDYKAILYDATWIVKKKHSDQMLMFVQELYEFHKEMLDKLISCNANIKSICTYFLEGSEAFRNHIHYIGNIPQAEKIYNTYYETFKQTNPSLGDDLRKPRMRMNHYILTLESLKKNCEEEEKSLIQNVITVFKEYLKEADTRLVTDSVYLCPCNLLEYGYLVINGELSLKKGAGLNKIRYQVLLLEKILVLAKGSPDKSEYVTHFHLQDAHIVHEFRGVLIHLKVNMNQPKSILLIFKAKTIKMQQKWISKLKDQIDIVKNESSENEKQSGDHDSLLSKSVTTFPGDNYPQSNSRKLPNKQPPLTIEAAFNNKYESLKLEKPKENMHLYTRNIQDSEKLLIKNIDHLLSQTQNENAISKYTQEVKHLYEFHLRYFYPAISYDKINFDTYVHKGILKHRTNFVKSYEKVLYLAAIIKHEGADNLMYIPVFEVIMDNFFKYKFYFSKIYKGTDDQTECNIKEVNIIFKSITSSANLLLKCKYISNLPSPFNEQVVVEGMLSVRESLEDVDNVTYVILTRTNTYFLSYTKDKYSIHTTFKNENGIMGPSTSLASFQLKFISPGKQRRKFNFTAKDVDSKNKWYNGFCKTLSQDTKDKVVKDSNHVRRSKSEIVAKSKILKSRKMIKEEQYFPVKRDKSHGIYRESDL